MSSPHSRDTHGNPEAPKRGRKKSSSHGAVELGNASLRAIMNERNVDIEPKLQRLRGMKSEETPEKGPDVAKAKRVNTPTRANKRKAATAIPADEADRAEIAHKQHQAKVNSVPAEPAETDASQEEELDELQDHRVNVENATVEMLVKWSDGEVSWEQEWDLQTQLPEAVFKYWDQYESREEATGLDAFHVFRLLKRSMSPEGRQSRYLVQWVGYRRTDATWEPEHKVRDIAPAELNRFEAEHGTSEEVASKKRASKKRGVGRPRKKARRVSPDDD